VKILMSALACEPHKGSEPEVGFRAMIAAASRHEVWLLTNQANVASLQQALTSYPEKSVAERVRIYGIDFGVEGDRFDHLSAAGHHWFYDRWQKKAQRASLELDERFDFDVIHQVTLASYWTRVGIAAVPKPMVLGPIGGGLNVPGRLLPLLGVRGLAQEAVRSVARFTLSRVPSIRSARRTSAVVFAQNQATARRISDTQGVSWLSNALCVAMETMPFSGARSKDLLFVGRLLAWKAPILALRALRYVTDTDTILRFCGDGPERERLERTARRWGLEDRVRFEGWLNRADLLELMAASGAVVHPCLREEAGLSVTEALSLGTPVVLLDHGGPGEIASRWPGSVRFRVRPGSPDRTAREMAVAIERAIREAPPVPAHPQPAPISFDSAILEAYEVAAGRRRPGHEPSPPAEARKGERAG
jgi:glycosyltransferase involved in cell wall biosynthesis